MVYNPSIAVAVVWRGGSSRLHSVCTLHVSLQKKNYLTPVVFAKKAVPVFCPFCSPLARRPSRN